MLQPRNLKHKINNRNVSVLLALFFALQSIVNAQFIDSDDSDVRPTPTLRLSDQDVTTVLLVDTKDRAAHGKFFNIKPEVGLLKSTARTFIQEGVTTEYATQVVGTTLENGLYAQLLATTSRVLYEHDNNAATKLPALHLQYNEISPPHDKNDWNAQFIKNTDYISPNNPLLIYPSRHNYDPVANRQAKELASLVTASHIKHEPLPEFQAQVANRDSSTESGTSAENNSTSTAKVEEIISPKKVISNSDLPTFTVSNIFAPSGFSVDDPNEIVTERNAYTTKAERIAKVLFRGGVPEQDLKHFSTVTYYGFADFTTIVGDTVIVFSPSTAAPSGGGQVTSIQGEATLQEPVATKTKTFVSQKEQMSTETVPRHNVVMQTSLPTFVVEPVTPSRDSKEMEDEEYDTSTIPYSTSESTESSEEELVKKLNVLSREQDVSKYDTTTPTIDEISEEITTNEHTTPKVFGVTPEQIQPSEVSVVNDKPTLSKPSNEDILKVLASLQAKEVEEQSKAPEKVVQTGVTTIFFDDDPFAIEPTQVVTTVKPSEKQETTTEQQKVETTTEKKSQALTEKPLETTTDSEEQTTTDKVKETTEKTKETTTVKSDELLEREVEVQKALRKIKAKEELGCKDDVQIIPSTIFKTLTYLTTYFIPDQKNPDVTSTSVKSNAKVSSSVHYASECIDEIEPTNVVTESLATVKVDETTLKVTTTDDSSEETTETDSTTEALLSTTESSEEEETTLSNDVKQTTEIVTTKMHVTEEPERVTTEKPENNDEEGEDYDSEEEIDVIYKTLYTTYTYLTTFFVDATSSVSSRKEVVTNVITQTLDPNENSDLIALINDMADKPTVIQPTKTGKVLLDPNTATDVGVGRPTTTFNIPESDLIGINQLLEEQGLLSATPALDEKYYLETQGPKTLFTTYTYFTTVFVDGETEISSRTEVFTNIVNQDNVTPTVKPELIDATEYVQKKDNDVLDSSSDEHELTVESKKVSQVNKNSLDDDNKIDNEIVHPKYSTMVRNPTSAENVDNDGETVVTMVTDVRSSSSLGEKQFIDRIDQESSESNNEEVLPSPQLLLQTSYTTFTYFTTLFNPSASTSKIESRLETITNVVTETLNPTQTLQLNDDTAPITYYTTFTYWTTLFKDGQTTTTSREETISNVVNPTAVVKFDSSDASSIEKIVPTSVVAPVLELQTATVQPSSANNDESEKEEKKDVSSTDVSSTIEPTTYYTTYTYFTTSYIGDETVLNSRFETITNVVTPTPVEVVKPTSRAIDLNNRNNLLDGDEKSKTFAPAYVFPSSYTEQTESPAKVVPFLPQTDPLKPTGILFLNEGKIVDADGISSILYTTKTIGTVIDDQYTQVVESSSKVEVDEIKKALKTSDTDVVPGNRKTGLVRLYDGTIVANHTTTFYQSKVIGTYIDEKYAQIIESTSSFVIEKTIEPSNVQGLNIQPTATVGVNEGSKASINPTPAVLAGSISDVHDDSENEDEDDDEEGSGKSRLSYTPKKPTFTPVIRPFASRPRPTFNPAKKNRGGVTSAQTITRSDITPTITATPTVKGESSSSRNRFGSGRRTSSAINNNVIQSSSAAAVGSGGSSRRFSRPGRVTPTASLGLQSSRIRPTSSIRIQPTAGGQLSASSRRGGLRSSSIQPRINLSSTFAGNSRFNRIRPTASVGTSPSTAGITTTPNDFTESPDVITHEVTQTATDDSVEQEEQVPTTTENSRRRGNPLLNFRRPPISRQPGTAAGSSGTSRPSAPISTRRNPLARTTQKTTTTTTTTTARPKARQFSRPSPLPIAPIGSRPRPAGSNLFPPRGLLRTTQPPKPAEEEETNENEEEADDTENDFSDDTDQQGSNIEEQVVEQAKPEPAKAAPGKPNIRPFVGFRRRNKRQVDYGSRYQSRYNAQRKQKPQVVDYYYEDETEAPPKTTPRTTASRFRSRSTQQPQTSNRIRPTSASSVQNRSQFTLRDNSNTNTRNSNFRRPQTSSLNSNRRAAVTRSSSRYNQYSNTNNRNTQRPRTTNSGRRTSSRTRVPKVDPYIPQNDGTITVTHHIPTETKIPVVNNGQTEYKNIITEKTSVEVLGPKQYYTSSDPMGKLVTLLSSDMTAVNHNGLTEVTQFVLFETPTSSIIFTPTTIRGRRTSFSHIIPSTVYDVHPTVSTNNVGLAANAPLANILLSQLLLGNVGLPLQQQQTINPLLPFQPQPQPQIANTPMTEFKVRTTMYETTLTSATSTILPLTFHGKQILTTIVETSTNVITATEFITDTIVVTPTVQQNQQQQLNSLLLPLLLQQQPQIQQPIASQETGILNHIPDTHLTETLESDEKQFDNIQSIRDDNSRSKEVDEYDTYDDLAVKKPVEKPKTSPLKNFKKYGHQEQFKPVSVAAPKTSVVTLYVSGRRPGEFSTVLSTYIVGEDSAVSKRSANYVEVIPSQLPNIQQDKKIEIDDLVDIYQAEASNNIDEFYLAGTNEINLESSQEQQRLYDSETASLESVLGDFSQYYVPESRQKNREQATSYFLG